MNKLSVISYVVADYSIDDVIVNIYFAPAVVTTFLSTSEIASLGRKNDKNATIFNEIFSIIKEQVSSFGTYEVWYDLIEYNGVELVWKSKYMENTKTMLVDVLHFENKNEENEVFH